MRVTRSASPPPRSTSPDLIPQSLPSPHLSKRKSSSRLNLKLAYAKDSPPRSTHSLPESDHLPRVSSACPLSEAVAKLDLAIDEFGTKDIGPKSSNHTSVDNSRVAFPRSEPDGSSNSSSSSSSSSSHKRGHRRSLASSPRQSSHHALPPSHMRVRSRSGSPPPVAHKSPPPPLPPIPSFLLSAADKTVDEDGLQHIYISDMNFSYSISPSQKKPSPSQSHHALARVKFFAVHHDGSSTMPLA